MKTFLLFTLSILWLVFSAFGADTTPKTITASSLNGSLLWPTNFFSANSNSIWTVLGGGETGVLAIERGGTGTTNAAGLRGVIGLDAGDPGSMGTNWLTLSTAAEGRGVLGLDVATPGALGTNMLTQATAGGVRSLVGLDAGTPGALGTNLLTQATAAGVRGLIGLNPADPGSMGTNWLTLSTAGDGRSALGLGEWGTNTNFGLQTTSTSVRFTTAADDTTIVGVRFAGGSEASLLSMSTVGNGLLLTEADGTTPFVPDNISPSGVMNYSTLTNLFVLSTNGYARLPLLDDDPTSLVSADYARIYNRIGQKGRATLHGQTLSGATNLAAEVVMVGPDAVATVDTIILGSTNIVGAVAGKQATNVVADLTALEAYAGDSLSVTVTDANRGGVFAYEASGYTANGGTVFDAIGIGTGYWVRQYNGPINVLWWGCDNTGVTDNMTKLQTLFDSLTSGGTVQFPPGDYLFQGATNCTISSPSRVYITNSNVHITGQPGARILMKGPTANYLNTILDSSGSGRDVFTAFSFANSDNSSVSDLEFWGEFEHDTVLYYPSTALAAPRAKAIGIFGSKDVTISRVKGYNLLGNTVHAVASSSTYEPYTSNGRLCDRIVVENCLAFGGFENGFNFQAGVYNSVIRSCVAQWNMFNGYEVSERTVTVQDCVSIGNYKSGYSGGGSPLFINCVATGNNSYGFCGTGRIRVYNCTAEGNGSAGIYLYADTSDSSFSNVTLRDNNSGSTGAGRAEFYIGGSTSSAATNIYVANITASSYRTNTSGVVTNKVNFANYSAINVRWPDTTGVFLNTTSDFYAGCRIAFGSSSRNASFAVVKSSGVTEVPGSYTNVVLYLDRLITNSISGGTTYSIGSGSIYGFYTAAAVRDCEFSSVNVGGYSTEPIKITAGINPHHTTNVTMTATTGGSTASSIPSGVLFSGRYDARKRSVMEFAGDGLLRIPRVATDAIAKFATYNPGESGQVGYNTSLNQPFWNRTTHGVSYFVGTENTAVPEPTLTSADWAGFYTTVDSSGVTRMAAAGYDGRKGEVSIGSRSPVTAQRTSLAGATKIVDESGDAIGNFDTGWTLGASWTTNSSAVVNATGVTNSLSHTTVTALVGPPRFVTMTLVSGGAWTVDADATLTVTIGGNLMRTFANGSEPSGTMTISGMVDGTTDEVVFTVYAPSAKTVSGSFDNFKIEVLAAGDFLHRHTYPAAALVKATSATAPAPYFEFTAGGTHAANGNAKDKVIALVNTTVTSAPAILATIASTDNNGSWRLKGKVYAAYGGGGTDYDNFMLELDYVDGSGTYTTSLHSTDLTGNVFAWNAAGYFLIGANADTADGDVTINTSSVEFKP